MQEKEVLIVKSLTFADFCWLDSDILFSQGFY